MGARGGGGGREVKKAVEGGHAGGVVWRVVSHD